MRRCGSGRDGATRRNTPSCIQLNGVYYISSCLKDNMRQ